MFIRSVRTIRFPVAFLDVIQTFPGATDKLLLIVETAESLIPTVRALDAAVAPHAAAPVLAGNLPGPPGDGAGTVELVLSLPAVGDSVTDRGGGETELVRTLEVVSVTWTVQLVSSVHTVSGPVTPPGGVNTGPGLAPPLCWTAQI